MAGDVRVGDRPAAASPGSSWPPTCGSTWPSGPSYVSRGGIKLANALDAFGIDPAGRHALDVGASTGGFTDCLLQRGAAAVVALDVAYGELHWRIRQDPRVTVIERRNARALGADELPYAARPDRGRRLVHLACQGAAGRARRPRRRVSTASRSSSRSSRSGASASARGGVVRTPDDRRGALVAVAGSLARSWAQRCWDSPRPGCRARPATARASCGSPRPGAPGLSRTSRPRRGRAEP